MSETPREETPDQVASPSVSTAPAGAAPPSPRSRWHWSSVPDHLGRARTSTVVLCVLFLLIGALYLYVRPEERQERASRSTETGQVTTPATTPPPTTTAPETTTSPAEPTEEPTETTPATPTGTTTGTPGPTTPGTTTPTTGRTTPTDEAPTEGTGPAPTAPTTP